MANLNVLLRLLAYEDASATSSPERRAPDWGRSMTGIAAVKPQAAEYQIPAGASLSVISGTRSTTIDSGTNISVAVSPIDPTRYRFEWTFGNFTPPGFRTFRNMNLTGHALTWTVSPNATVTLTSSTVGDFINLSEGDQVYFQGVADGVSTPVDPLNQGYWRVLAIDVTSTSLQLARLPGETFEALAGSATPTDVLQVLAFSAAGVQPGDTLDLNTAFPAALLRSYEVLSATCYWVDVRATDPLPTGLDANPTNAGMVFYSNAKRLIYVEADQDCALQLNGASGSATRLSPWTAGDDSGRAMYLHTGPVWSLTIVNRATVEATVFVASVE